MLRKRHVIKVDARSKSEVSFHGIGRCSSDCDQTRRMRTDEALDNSLDLRPCLYTSMVVVLMFY